jgi:uncharacterized protein (DUF1501 family)
MSQSRRDFLKSSGLVIMAGAAGYMGADEFVRGQFANYGATHGGMDADARQRPTLVTIFLRGGCDALNAFVPYGDSLYYKYRQRIALYPTASGKGKGKEAGLTAIGNSDYWGINMGLAPIAPLMEQGVLVPIMNVGSIDGTRSHFSAQDNVERASLSHSGVTTGWLNRYLEATKKPYDAPLRGLSAQNLVPRALRGSYPVLAGNNSTNEMDLFEDLYSNKNLVNMTARDGAGQERGSRLEDADVKPEEHALTADMTRDVISMSGANSVERIKALEKAEATETNADYPGGGLANQLRTIAKVIKADVGLEVAQADYGGWDHHSGEGGAGGRHAMMLNELALNLAAFNKDLGSRMNRVMVLVMTEFGRTVADNGAGGTDHGRGGFMIAMSNSLVPQATSNKVLGTWKGMTDTDYGRFLPVHTDHRAIFAESLTRMFHVDPFSTGILPGYKGGPQSFLNFVQQLPEGA